MASICKVYSFKYIIEERNRFFIRKTGKLSLDPHPYTSYKDEYLEAEWVLRDDMDFKDRLEFVKNNAFGFDEGGCNRYLRVIEVRDGYMSYHEPLNEVFLMWDMETNKFNEVEYDV